MHGSMGMDWQGGSQDGLDLEWQQRQTRCQVSVDATWIDWAWIREQVSVGTLKIWEWGTGTGVGQGLARRMLKQVGAGGDVHG